MRDRAMRRCAAHVDAQSISRTKEAAANYPVHRVSVSQERRCKRGGGYRIQAKSYRLWQIRGSLHFLETNKMRKIGLFLMAAVAVMIAAMPAFAQAANDAAAAATASASGTKAIAAGVGFAIAGVFGAIGQFTVGGGAFGDGRGRAR